MDEMDWAPWTLRYLKDARTAIHDEFNDVMGEIAGYHGARGESWFSTCKNIIQTLYHYSLEFVADTQIPSGEFASPQAVEEKLVEYRAFVHAMLIDLDKEAEAYRAKHKVDGPPFLVSAARKPASYLLSAIDYVTSKRPKPGTIAPEVDDIGLIVELGRRFHESVLSLRKHPHGGSTITIADEWDCQYLFRAILAGYFADIRDEEWNPSVAGTSARCEFFLKALRLMVELKFVRKASDVTKVKTELATDLLDYGANPLVDHVLCLVYDPGHALKNPAALQTDLSGPTKGLTSVRVVVSPPRDG